MWIFPQPPMNQPPMNQPSYFPDTSSYRSNIRFTKAMNPSTDTFSRQSSTPSQYNGGQQRL